MAAVMHLDTNVLVWLFGRQRHRIPATAQERMNAEPLAVSPVVELELTYLFEVGRLRVPAAEVMGELAPALELEVSVTPLRSIVTRAVQLTWTRDPFDRLISAHALADNAALLTADETIRRHLPVAVWALDQQGPSADHEPGAAPQR